MIATGGARNSAPGTLNQLFLDAVAKFRKPDALQVKRSGRYEPISHEELADRVRHTALGLAELGVRTGDRVAIFASNADQAAKIAAIRGECPAVRHVITFASSADNADLTLAALEATGSAADNEARRVAYRARAVAVHPGD